MDNCAAAIVTVTLRFTVRSIGVHLALLLRTAQPFGPTTAWRPRGLTMPLAAAKALAAGYAAVNVFDIAKCTVLPALLAAVIVALILGLFG